MIINKAFKFRIYPNHEQRTQLTRQFGSSRFVYNHFLRQRIDYYEIHKNNEKKKGLTYNDTTARLTELKKTQELIWLTESNSQVLQQSLRDLDVAYNNFFNKRSEFPKFKKKNSKQSFRVPQHFSVEDEKLYIPKFDSIKIVVHREIEGEMKSVTISKTAAGNYFASILCELEIEPEPRKVKKEIGIDLGIKSFLVSSDGERVSSPKFLRASEHKMGILQRRLSRKVIGSNGRNKSRLKVARLHEKIANQRKDFLHKLSRRLVDENQAIFAEDLHVKGMVRNHNLAKSISDQGWSEFVRQLEYKSEWVGGEFVQIDRFFPSSKRHAGCGWINEDLKLADREWKCLECGDIVDRDLNAAKNIVSFGKTKSTVGSTETQRRGRSPVRGSLNSEAMRL